VKVRGGYAVSLFTIVTILWLLLTYTPT
jgi:hypothetical protein